MDNSKQWKNQGSDLHQKRYARMRKPIACITLLAILLSVSFGPFASLAAALPAPPVAVGGEESVSASSFTPGATLKLYLGNASLIATASSVTTETYTFTDVVPSNLGFYVTQTVSGEESVNSSFVGVSLRTPTSAAGIGYVDVSNVLNGATVRLYDDGGALISSSPSNQGAGVWRFSGLTARKTYYAIQSINGVVSLNSSFVTVQPDIPSPPTATGGEESLIVSDFTSGATLKLYLGNNSLIATAPSVTTATYTFTDVVPSNLGFYVTQTVGIEESVNSSFVGVSLRTPSVVAGLDYVDVSNVLNGATVSLYDDSGAAISSSPSNQGAGVWRFSGLTARETYYAVQSINGVVSLNSSFVTVQPDIPSPPTATGGEESLIASDFTSGATLKLYLGNNSLIATAPSVTTATYTFTDVVPSNLGFYVTQTVGIEESVNSSFVGVSLRTPSVVAGLDYVDVSNVLNGATVSLYDDSGAAISSSPSNQGAGVWRFSGLTARETYYAIQSINGVVSLNSSFVTVQPDIPSPPTATGGEESLIASDFTSGATLKLYLTNGSLIATAPSVTEATYTFTGVVPNSLGFYVTQTVGNEESENSSFVGASLRMPSAAAGLDYVDVSNVLNGAYVTLYDSDDQVISSSPSDQGSGVWRYGGLTAGKTYYAIQSINGVISLNSRFVTLPSAPDAPTNVTASAGDRQAVVRFTPPVEHGGRPITEYKVLVLPDNIAVTGNSSPMTINGLTNGKRYTFKVAAVNAVGESEWSSESNAIYPQASSSTDNSSSGETAPGQTDSSTAEGLNVLVNGKIENAGTVTKNKVNGRQTLTISVDERKLLQRLEAEGIGAVITIPVTAVGDVFIAELSGRMVKQMEAQKATVELRIGQGSYKIPAVQFDIDSIARQVGNGADLQNVKIHLEIAVPLKDTLNLVETAAAKGGWKLVAPPLEFRVNAVQDGRTIEISKFNAYVERTLAMPEGITPNRMTTGVIVEPDGTVRHVPTQIAMVNGKYTATINSLTNSAYAVIWNPLEFEDITNHWAKASINNMGSRLIINGTGEGRFSPNRDITRAEFAAIIVRALGLKPESGTASFTDVRTVDWYNHEVATAHAYGLIQGFEDGSFRPSERITREQAMVILSKAMSITGLAARLESNESYALADMTQISKWAAEGILKSLASGVVNGRSGGLLAPKDFVTRAEVAVMAERLLERSNLI
ncbi:S-layer homology domain-containing protein [Cohnella sp. LGH]|uniref:S-layer homology domain-containing protein n=1 Tax=Cohnella sp. LGH TaxID=1619153 RepID=UPI001AD9653C|nr:S-layer homology domain-containing protein [Cohnella sp. LGH]QTH41933.1 S-layer homology domain-containing protein [Cohnella sp. LGH]